MMKKVPFLFLSLFLSLYTLSQDVDKAMDYYNREKYDSAAIEFEAALPLIEQKYGATDTSYYFKLVVYTAESFENIQQYDKAVNYYLQVKSILETINAIRNDDYTATLNNLARLYQVMGDYKQAEFLFNEAMKIDSIHADKHKTDFTRDINNLAALYMDMGHYQQSETLYKQAIEINKVELGENQPEYASNLSNLGVLYSKMGQYEKAEHLYKQALEIARIQLDEKNPDYVQYINNLAVLYFNLGIFEKAESLMKQVLDIDNFKLAQNHPDYYKHLNTLAAVYITTGLYEKAEPLIKQSIEICKKQLGENQPNYATGLNNLAQLYFLEGRYEEAESLYLKSVDIIKNQFDEVNPDYDKTLNNLAQLYMTMGRYDQAEPFMKRALEMTKVQLGDNHPAYAVRLNNLAQLYLKKGYYELAEPLMKQALDIDKKKLGEKHPQFARHLNNLGELFTEMKQFDSAEILYKQSIEVLKKQGGENHPQYAKFLFNLAELNQSMGHYEKADALMKEAIEIDKLLLDKNHPIYAADLNNLGDLYQAMGKNEEVDSLYKLAFSIYQYQIKMNTGFLSVKELASFLNTFLYRLDIYQSFINKQIQNHSTSGDFAYDIELTCKCILLKSALGVKTRILECGDTSLINTFYDLRYLRKKIDKLKTTTPDKRSEDPVKLEARANDMEKNLKLKSKDYRDAKQENEITWKDIQKNLKPGEAALEFSSFHYYNGKKSTDSILYCAVLIRNDDAIPQMVYLAEETQLKRDIPPTNFPKEINLTYSGKQIKPAINNNSLSNNDRSLYDLVWKPFDSLLQGIKTVYFAPSGLLNSISLAAITCPDNKALMDKYKLVQLSSTRTLALPQESKPISTAVVYGGIRYDSDTTLLLTKAEKYHKKEIELLASNRSTPKDNRSGFRYLPGTLKEAELITVRLKKQGITTTTYSGIDALEESFVALSGKSSPSVIHLSTHGFYYPDTISDKNRKDIMYSSTGEVQFRYSDDPLIRSGLLMAGANLAWKGETLPANVEDGILTAKEVSNMNLMNTQLVVLSACQTGLGDVKGSEGVEGLQRGFKMAGVRYIIMSLWDVPDKETTEFMSSFYDNWLGGKNIHDAFQATQVSMKKKYKNEPYKWAAFVLVE